MPAEDENEAQERDPDRHGRVGAKGEDEVAVAEGAGRWKVGRQGDGRGCVWCRDGERSVAGWLGGAWRR